jgi:hypothetical protein
MSKARLAPAAPINLVRLAIAFTAVMATMAAMASSAFATDSSSCSTPGKCTSLINIEHNDVDIKLEGTSFLSDIELVHLKNVAILSNNSFACIQIVALLSAECSKAIANGILALSLSASRTSTSRSWAANSPITTTSRSVWSVMKH